jgi:hypothetical protein
MAGATQDYDAEAPLESCTAAQPFDGRVELRAGTAGENFVDAPRVLLERQPSIGVALAQSRDRLIPIVVG